MRNGQKRMRGRSGGGGGGGGHNNNNNNNNNNHRKSQNPLTRVYESNGPDVKIRGTASHIAEKYMQLARDAQTSSDPVAAENYFQHAEHYFRLIATAQEQFRQQNPYYNNPAPTPGAPTGAADDSYDDGDDDQPFVAQPGEPGFNQQQPQQNQQPQPPQNQQQPYLPRDAQPFPPRDQPQNNRPQHQQHNNQPRQDHQQRPQQNNNNVQPNNNIQPEVTGLPAFITGGGQQPQPAVAAEGDANGQNGQNGNDQGDRPDRFGRRRRRHRSGSNFRPDFNGNVEAGAAPAPASGGDEPSGQPE